MLCLFSPHAQYRWNQSRLETRKHYETQIPKGRSAFIYPDEEQPSQKDFGKQKFEREHGLHVPYFSTHKIVERVTERGGGDYHDQSDYMKINKLRISMILLLMTKHYTTDWSIPLLLITSIILNINSVLMIIVYTCRLSFLCPSLLTWQWKISNLVCWNSYCVLFYGASCILHKIFLNQLILSLALDFLSHCLKV